MVDNKDEYQLPEDEKTEEYTPKAYQNSTENILSMLKNQRVQMMLMGAIGVSIVMYLVTSYLEGDETPKDTPDQANTTNDQVGPNTNTDKPDADKPDADKSTPAIQPSNDRLDRIEGMIKDQNDHVQAIQAQMQAMQTQVTQQQGDNQAALDALNEAVKELQSDLKPKPEVKPEAPLEHYRVRAAMNGMAYIVNNDTGASTTVVVGDEVNTYGTIITIDDVRQVIETSSGRLIEINREAN